jgi:hypothetical protein
LQPGLLAEAQGTYTEWRRGIEKLKKPNPHNPHPVAETEVP